MNPRRVAIVLLGLSAAAAGCASDPSQGYAFASSYRRDVGSISVPIFQNTTFAHGVETQLTEAVIAELRKATPWAVVGGDNAHTTLRGAVVAADLTRLSTARDSGLVEQLAVAITVDFEWKDNRTGKVLAVRRGFTAAEGFVPARGIDGPLNERLETGQFATIQELARDIVAELRAAW